MDVKYKNLTDKQKNGILYGTKERMIVVLPGFDNEPRSLRFE